MSGEARSRAVPTQRVVRGRPRGGRIVTGSDRVVDALQLRGGSATLAALVDALEPVLGRRETRAYIELARIGGRITLTECEDGLVARLAEGER
jgi:hypothetical protein